MTKWELYRQGFFTIGFAYNINIIAQAKSTIAIRERIQLTLNIVSDWAISEDLSINPQKTTIVPVTKRMKLDGLRPLTLNEKNLTVVWDVKYLGDFEFQVDLKPTHCQTNEKAVMRITYTVTVKILLNLSPLDLVKQGKGRRFLH